LDGPKAARFLAVGNGPVMRYFQGVVANATRNGSLSRFGALRSPAINVCALATPLWLQSAQYRQFTPQHEADA
jgi:hypothetical protein